MNAPHAPLVVVLAHSPAGAAPKDAEELSRKAAVMWRGRVKEREALARREVVFTWMDAERWASWVKSMYGIKGGDVPSVVITDHRVREVAVSFDSMLAKS